MTTQRLPQLISRKIYKTGQTRGADDDVIFQNRVGRNSTALIPYSQYEPYLNLQADGFAFENGFIVLIAPKDYFENKDITQELSANGLEIGKNALVFYEKRTDWNNYNPEKSGWVPAQNRKSPLQGQYVARVAATTAIEGGEKIVRGFTTSAGKGAGIRVYEYASKEVIQKCRMQLEAIFWLCIDSERVVLNYGMSNEDARQRKQSIIDICVEEGLLDYDKLKENRIINNAHHSICPLCLEELSAQGFFSKVEQALGREVHDLTVTQLNLFHIQELRFGVFNHRQYNLGWGHHHCNVVTKDAGLDETLKWMQEILDRNAQYGLSTASNNEA